MILLHAARVSGRLWLWGEAPPSSSPLPDDPGVLPPLTPFDAGPERLFEGLARAAGGFRPTPDRATPLVAWLPARNRQPVPSSPLVAEAPPEEGSREIRPWRVTSLALDPEEALTLLATAADRDTLGPGLPVTPDLGFWVEALRLSGRLVAGRHVVPGMVGEDDRHEARWRPVFQGVELEALARLERAMPASARALVEPEPTERASARAVDAAEPPDRSPLDEVRGFVTRMCDHLMRSAQWSGGILPGPNPDRECNDDPGDDAGPVDQRWLDALRAPDPVVRGPRRDRVDLARRLKDWRRPLTRVLDAPWRLCFRLEEPELKESVPPTNPEDEGAGGEDEGDAGGAPATGQDRGGARPWRLRYLLQNAADPSLLVPAGDAWTAGPRPGADFLGRDPRLRERLLQTLGQAARLSAAVARSLDEAEPTGARLDPGAAHRFLREEAPLLREAGFGVHLPAWWTRDRRRLKPSVRAVADGGDLRASSGLGLDDLVSVRWKLALGGEAVSAEELEALARMKAPLVRLRGRWVEVDGDELRRALAQISDADDGELLAGRLVRMALGAEDGPGGLPVEEVRARGPLGELLEGLEGKAEFRTLPVPEGLEAELRPYQRRGFSWLAFLSRWGLGACLADDMGLGKTVQTLALVQRDREARTPKPEEDGEREPREENEDGQGSPAVRPVLVVCPTSVVTNWEREAARFTPDLRVQVHHGRNRPSGEELEKTVAGSDLVLTTYGLLHRDVEDLDRVRWRGLVLDEAQNVKNPETKRARAARTLDADYRVALTGTPVENHVGDLWSIMEILNPGLLGSRASFRRRFFLPIQTARDPAATTRLRRITGPFVLRRLKTDRSIIRDLPERIESRVYCTLTREQASLYAAVLRELEEGLGGGAEGIGRRGLVLATLTHLKQVCNHPAHFLDDGSPIPGRSGKVERLVELLEEMREADGRALVFTQYTTMGEILRGHLQERFGREVPFLHGGVSRRRREKMVDRFQEPDGPEIFLLSLKAGGTGLNLTAANHVFLFDRWWNPAVEAQAMDRAFRIGQRRNVQVHRFVCTGTLEERIDEIVEGKRKLARNVVGTGEGWLTELSDVELREVLALAPDAGGTDADEEGEGS